MHDDIINDRHRRREKFPVQVHSARGRTAAPTSLLSANAHATRHKAHALREKLETFGQMQARLTAKEIAHRLSPLLDVRSQWRDHFQAGFLRGHFDARIPRPDDFEWSSLAEK